MLNPDVIVFGFSVSEPVTTLTDLITAVVCFLAYRRLRGRAGETDREVFLWGEFFFYLGLATLLSGLFGHALKERVPEGLRLVAWSFSGVAVLFAQRATNSVVRETRVTGAVPWIQLTLFLVLLWLRRDFALVMYNLIVGLIVYVLPLQVRLIRAGKAPIGRRRVVTGIVSGLVPAFVFSRELGVSAWLNHHDVSHLLVAGVVYIIFRGALSIAEERESGGPGAGREPFGR